MPVQVPKPMVAAPARWHQPRSVTVSPSARNGRLSDGAEPSAGSANGWRPAWVISIIVPAWPAPGPETVPLPILCGKQEMK